MTTTYEYDALGQLVRVNDPNDKTVGNTGTTWVYAYDRGGNILRKTAYAYTTGEPDLDVITKLYEYNDTNWKDKLTKFDGHTITYDAIGNPLSDGTWTYVWQAGRQLKSMSKVEGGSTVTMEFTYNHAGLRTKKVKKVNGTVTETTEYILNGKNVVELIHTNHATSVTNRLHFFYDTQDKQAMVEFNGVKYSYAYNLQGDVVGIVDSTGGLVVQYSYDAWGKPISATANSTLTTQLAELNPYRYRGYAWDKEMELYYLESRYYTPSFGRFLNTDDIVDQQTVQRVQNLYSYCENNFANKVDNNGRWSLFATIATVVGVALCVAAVTVLTCGVGTATLAGAVAVGAAKGALVGAFVGTVVGAGVGYAKTGTKEGAVEGAAIGFGVGSVVGAAIGGSIAGTNFGTFSSSDALTTHFAKHGQEFNQLYTNAKEYAEGAKYVIKNGTYIAEKNAYIRFFGAGGKANYALVGMKEGGRVSTYHIESVKKLISDGVQFFSAIVD